MNPLDICKQPPRAHQLTDDSFRAPFSARNWSDGSSPSNHDTDGDDPSHSCSPKCCHLAEAAAEVVKGRKRIFALPYTRKTMLRSGGTITKGLSSNGPSGHSAGVLCLLYGLFIVTVWRRPLMAFCPLRHRPSPFSAHKECDGNSAERSLSGGEPRVYRLPTIYRRRKADGYPLRYRMPYAEHKVRCCCRWSLRLNYVQAYVADRATQGFLAIFSRGRLVVSSYYANAVPQFLSNETLPDR
uniref:Transmembrane protein n=1 Tax=Steinernema glaseri TaxID=37863 RepID=A0A1I7Z044_9BILA